MSKHKVSKSKVERKRQEWPLVVYVWMIGLAFFAYVVTRIALDGYPHPWHWGAGLAGGVIGTLVGWLWFRWRGDII